MDWINALGDKNRKEFLEELVNLVEDWRATGEVMSNPELMGILAEKEDPSQHIRMEE